MLTLPHIRSRIASVTLLLILSSVPTTPILSAEDVSLGTLVFPTSGAPEATPDFVFGVLYLHSFEYDLAAEAFRRAQAIDSDFAMAYWGEAMTHNHPLWRQQIGMPPSPR